MFEYQLWCYYETQDVWKLEGFFNTRERAQQQMVDLRNDVDTPCMPDWKVTRVEVV